MLSTGFELGSPWLSKCSYHHQLETRWVGVLLLGTRSSTNNGESLKKIYIPIHKVLELPWRHFTSLKLHKCSEIPHPSPRVTSISNRTKTNHCWLNLLQTLHIHYYANSLAKRLRGSSRNPRVTQGNLGLTSLPHYLD